MTTATPKEDIMTTEAPAPLSVPSTDSPYGWCENLEAAGRDNKLVRRAALDHYNAGDDVRRLAASIAKAAEDADATVRKGLHLNDWINQNASKYALAVQKYEMSAQYLIALCNATGIEFPETSGWFVAK